MSTIRLSEKVWSGVHTHLFSTPGEHFAFLLARWTYSRGEPVFMVREAILIPDDQISFSHGGWELTTEAIVRVVNVAACTHSALIEVHNHGGTRPRFSRTDREGLREFRTYILSSLPGCPYGATVWGDSTVYAEFFLPDGRIGTIDSITVTGGSFRQLVSKDDDLEPLGHTFDRQLPWFTAQGQHALSRMWIGVVGAGGTGSQIVQNLVYLGVRNFILIDDDKADETDMNRLIIATPADLGIQKALLGRRLIKSIAPDASVTVIDAKVQSLEALDALKGVDVLFGCVDNDGARLILNEVALAYGIPYFDLAVGIEVVDGRVEVVGGRIAIVLPGGPCLYCMQQIDITEARFFLGSLEEQAFQVAREYIQGMDIKAPSVVSLNASIAALATNEFAIFASGMRAVNVYTDLDLLGTGRQAKGQWVTPVHADVQQSCVQCVVAGTGDDTCIERYVQH